MRPDRIAELLSPFLGQDDAAKIDQLLPRISTYIDLLLRWNSRVNLTAIRNEEEIVTRHFGESLFAARKLFPFVDGKDGAANCSVADLGSGAGFPGIPLKLWAPEIMLTLIESNQKKVAFLREVARALTLTNIDIINARGETVARTFDAVTVRAVERFSEALSVASRLITSSGRLALLISSAQIEQAYGTLSHLIWEPAIPIPESTSRVMLVGRPEPTG
jgi:16S rRNA (guanine527-N7)-methyltransferase